MSLSQNQQNAQPKKQVLKKEYNKQKKSSTAINLRLSRLNPQRKNWGAILFLIALQVVHWKRGLPKKGKNKEKKALTVKPLLENIRQVQRKNLGTSLSQTPLHPNYLKPLMQVSQRK